jgi:hypothetical protein
LKEPIKVEDSMRIKRLQAGLTQAGRVRGIFYSKSVLEIKLQITFQLQSTCSNSQYYLSFPSEGGPIRCVAGGPFPVAKRWGIRQTVAFGDVEERAVLDTEAEIDLFRL